MSEEVKKRVHNKYEQVILAAMRARELSDGIGVRPEMEGKKITTIAMQELQDGMLSFGDEHTELSKVIAVKEAVKVKEESPEGE